MAVFENFEQKYGYSERLCSIRVEILCVLAIVVLTEFKIFNRLLRATSTEEFFYLFLAL